MRTIRWYSALLGAVGLAAHAYPGDDGQYREPANRDRYRACEDREAQSREQLMAQVKYRRELLRAKVERPRQGMALHP